MIPTAKVSIPKLVQDFESCLDSPYPQSGNGSTNLEDIQNGADVDCSGLFRAAFKAQHADIPHGSNTIWRSCLTDKGEINASTQFIVGMAVFKHKTDGQEPKKYRKDGQGNFSHIGLVVSVNPVQIIHASTNEMKVRKDTKKSGDGWTYWGLLKDVDYTSVMPQKPTVDAVTGADKIIYRTIAEDGSTVNLRARDSKQSGLVVRVPLGDTVELRQGIKCDSKFLPVRWFGYNRWWNGYIMKQYLEALE